MAVRIVEVEAGKGRQIVVQHPLQFAPRQIGPEGVLHAKGDAAAGQGGAHHQQHVVGGDPRRNGHVEGSAVLAEFPAPGRHLRSRTPADAAVVRQVARVPRPPVAGEVGRGRHGHLALRPGHRDGDHVLLDYLAQPHAGIETPRDDIEFLVGDGDVQGHLRIGLDEAGQQRPVEKALGDGGDRDPQQPPRWAGVTGVLQGTQQPGQGPGDLPLQAFARFGKTHAAGGALHQ